ncbi:MAG: hypothetical protein FD134_2654 [Gallionellaceae bacterium]|nr:MAG: hypothetical protein FD134_2654 [Gallionellaceae bacterium]
MISLDAIIKPFPPITIQMALKIARRAFNAKARELKCYAAKPEKCHPYALGTNEPCWYVLGPWSNDLNMLRSSRIVVISRVTGAVLYEGDAGDEG